MQTILSSITLITSNSHRWWVTATIALRHSWLGVFKILVSVNVTPKWCICMPVCACRWAWRSRIGKCIWPSSGGFGIIDQLYLHHLNYGLITWINKTSSSIGPFIVLYLWQYTLLNVSTPKYAWEEVVCLLTWNCILRCIASYSWPMAISSAVNLQDIHVHGEYS